MKKLSLTVSQRTLVKATVPPGGKENVQPMLCGMTVRLWRVRVFIVDSADG